MQTGFLSSIQFWAAQYFRLWEVLYEGDKITLFGLLTYDADTNQASIDETVAMMASNAKTQIMTLLRNDRSLNYFKAAGKIILAAILAVGVMACGKRVLEHMREISLQADREAL